MLTADIAYPVRADTLAPSALGSSGSTSSWYSRTPVPLVAPRPLGVAVQTAVPTVAPTPTPSLPNVRPPVLSTLPTLSPFVPVISRPAVAASVPNAVLVDPSPDMPLSLSTTSVTPAAATRAQKLLASASDNAPHSMKSGGMSFGLLVFVVFVAWYVFTHKR